MTIDGTAVNGSVTLATRDYGGNGPDLLFLPGGGQTLVDCDLLAPHLTPHFRLAAMDVRGHGHSSDGAFSFEAALEDLEAVLARLGMTGAAVVGHSLGGMIAALYGGTHPESLGVVNMDGHGGGKPHQFDGVDPDVVVGRVAELAALRAAQLSQPAAVMPAETIDALLRQYVDGYGFTEASARDLAARMLVPVEGGYGRRVSLETAGAITEAVEGLDLLEIYRDCKTSLLVYNAVATQPAPPGAPEWMAEHVAAFRRYLSKELSAMAEELPHVSYLEVEATHALGYEMPATIAAQITEFLIGD